MSVYTPLNTLQIQALLKDYSLGTLISFKGISEGIENSNYFITLQDDQAARKEYVLTLFEQLSANDLVFFTDLTAHLNAAQLPVPCPMLDMNGRKIKSLAGKPAVIVPKISGEHAQVVSLKQCEEIGRYLARLHQAGKNFPTQPINKRAYTWIKASSTLLEASLSPTEQELLTQVLASLKHFIQFKPSLPRGIIHGDLFRDNVLFNNNKISALIDFYNACHDDWLYDIAITVNDWCSTADGRLDQARADALLTHYQHERPFTQNEKQCWTALLLMASCRFWLSRLLSRQAFKSNKASASSQHPVSIKDPEEYQTIVSHRLRSHLSANIK